MREETLKSLVWVLDKLDERNLQDKLVRCMTQLQGDQEASLRTNAVIFIGRIAGRLREGVRVRVLAPALLKALKDPFLHCRIAGLRATLACINLLDASQLSTKVLPTACALFMDRSADVREQALTVLRVGTASLTSVHENMKRQEAAERERITAGDAGKDGSTASAGAESLWSGLGGGWTSFAWSGVGATASNNSNNSTSANSNTAELTPASSTINSSVGVALTAVSSQSSLVVETKTNSMKLTSSNSITADNDNYEGKEPVLTVSSTAWDDDFDLDLDDAPSLPPANAVVKPTITSTKAKERSGAGQSTSMKKAAVVKLSVNKDDSEDWDDF